MNNLLVNFLSVLLAAICCGASPHILSKSPNGPIGIVNGTHADIEEFPYLVQLYYSEKVFVCSGAIIDERWILTAGQCTDYHITDVAYGASVVGDSLPETNTVKVKKSFRHPKFYRNRTFYGDIPVYNVAVLELEEPIQFNNKAQPLKLAESNDVPFHVLGVLAGWGLNGSHRSDSHLNKVELELLNDSECFLEIQSSTSADVFNAVHNLCNDERYGGQCDGDYGSPLVINSLGYGVVSYFFETCGPSPGAYSRITNPEYREFIRDLTGV